MKARSLVVLTLAAAFVSAGPLFAGGSAEQPQAGGKSLTIALVVKSQDDAYQALQQGGLAAAKDLGNVDVSYQGPATPSAADQAKIIDDLVKQKVSAIVIAPSETGDAVAPLEDSLTKAVKAGIKVVTIDQSLAAGGPLLEVRSPSNEVVGRMLVKATASQIGDAGEIGILSSSPDAAYQNAVIDGIKKELTAHQNIRLDAILYGNDLADKSGRETAAMLKAYPNMKAIIAPTTVGLAAAAKALEAAGLGGKVQLTGLGVPADMKQYFDTGTCMQMLLGIPLDTGYGATYVAATLARGQFKGNRGENLKAGRLGTLQVDQQGRVPVPPPTLVTKDTIDSFLETQ
jgi:rhamnose transport system substrate-binding protein